MKRFIVGFVCMFVFLVSLASCSSHTCPTYAKYAPYKSVKVRYR